MPRVVLFLGSFFFLIRGALTAAQVGNVRIARNCTYVYQRHAFDEAGSETSSSRKPALLWSALDLLNLPLLQ